MSFRRVSTLIATAAVVGCLIATALLQWRTLGDRPVLHSLLLLSLSFIGIAGAIHLCRHCTRLNRTIASIAKQFDKEQLPASVQSAGPAIGKLTDAVGACLSRYRQSLESLQNQVRDIQIQAQLSRRQKKNTEAIIYSLRDAVLVIDAFDRLSMANEAAGKLFGFDYSTAQQKLLTELLKDDKSDFLHFVRQAGQSKAEATRCEIVLPRTDKPHTFDCIVSCVHDENQQVCGVVAVLHDITREKEVSQMKSDFVSHVSHELKTPLASITAYSEMLLDGEAGDEQTRKDFCSVIQSQAQRLNRLIEDILNVSRIESGLMKVNKQPISLTILIEEQLSMIRSYAEEKNIKVITQKPIIYDQVRADKDMISQVIVNLLSNAVKYTPAGGSVSIQTDVDEIEGVARVSVTDTGVGIPEDELDHLFEKFYRVNANKKMAPGTGLGLNLVKQIVEKVHNGRVFVKSKVGSGSTFGFELPLATRQTVEVT